MKIAKSMWGLAAGGALLFAGAGSQAVPISGTIGLSGGYLANGPLATATAISSFTSVLVSGVGLTGDYAGTAGTPVTMSPFTFSPFQGSVVPLWTFTVGSTTYAFDLLSLGVTLQDSTQIVLDGSGTLHLTGKDDTGGTWSLHLSEAGDGNFTFTDGNTFDSTTAVPDGGTTLMLLGSALAVLGIARRYFKVA